MEDIKKIDAHKYADDFEELSLDVINLIFESKYNTQNIILSDTTQKTRDKGVDAYIVLKVGSSYYTYTIEAKLRNSSMLSLKDFASSIIYCLINTSYKHFVVTNVSFSDEATSVINRLNRNKYKKVELVDGKKLQQIINEHLFQFSKYPNELIKFIQGQTFQHTVHSIEMDSFVINDSFIIKVDSREKYRQKIEDYIDIGYNLFLIAGTFGVGKYTLIKELMEGVKTTCFCREIDLSIIQTPKMMIWELLKFLFGIELEDLFALIRNEEDNGTDFLDDFQVFPSIDKEILYALTILLDKNCYSYEETIYYMNFLCQKIINQYFSGITIIFGIINLHYATQEMITFVFDFLSCLIKNRIVVLIDLLYPKMQSEIKYVTLEQWYNYIQLLKNFRLNKIPVLISLENFTENEIKFIIEQFLPIQSISLDYKQKFIEYFGTNPQEIFLALSVIKKKKLYTINLLKKMIYQSIPQIVDGIIYNSINELESPKSDICYELFNFIYIMEGKISYCIFDYIIEKYEISDISFLKELGLFKFQNDFLVLKQFISMEYISKYVDKMQQRMCAIWLSEHIKDIGFDSIRKAYFEYKFMFIRFPQKVVSNTSNVADFLRKNQAYDLAILVRYMSSNFYKTIHDDKQYYTNAVDFLELLVDINPFNSYDISIKIQDLEELRLELEVFHSSDLEFIKSNIKFAFIQYKKEKANYDYKSCEKIIAYILKYENMVEKKSYFMRAYIYKALIKKEQGLRNEFIIGMIEALNKYPDSKEIKVAYYANLAAMYKIGHLNISMKLLNIVMQLTQGDYTIRGSLWTEIDHLQYRCFIGTTKYDEIKMIRKKAEKIASTDNLARSFNMEGYYYLKQLNLLSAKECLETSISISLSAGESKMYFLFTLNLISIMRLMKLDYTKLFYSSLSWFQNHFTEVILRLKNNRNRQEDHMFSAMINFVILLKEMKVSSNILTSNDFLFNYIELSYNKLLKLIPDFYKLNNTIFILY